MNDEREFQQRLERINQLFRRFNTLMTKQQQILLQKLIYKDSMHIDDAVPEDGFMMEQLYNLFFAWKTEEDLPEVDEAAIALENLTEEQKAEKALQEKEDKRKREEFERDQALIEFEERGGFSRVLKDIFNPSDMAAMELDSVF